MQVVAVVEGSGVVRAERVDRAEPALLREQRAQDDLPVPRVEHRDVTHQLGAVVGHVRAVQVEPFRVGPGRHVVVVLAEEHAPIAQASERAVEDRAADRGVVGAETGDDALSQPAGAVQCSSSTATIAPRGLRRRRRSSGIVAR